MSNPLDPNTSNNTVAEWDRFRLANNIFPGRAEIKFQGGVERKIDDRSAAGSDGWRLIDKGAQPVKFTVMFELWLPIQMDDAQRILRDLSTRLVRRAQRNASSVYHPTLAVLGVDRAYLTKINGLEHKGRGLWSFELSFVQFKPPTQRPGSRTRAVTATTVTPATTRANAIINPDGTRPAAQRDTTPHTTAR